LVIWPHQVAPFRQEPFGLATRVQGLTGRNKKKLAATGLVTGYRPQTGLAIKNFSFPPSSFPKIPYNRSSGRSAMTETSPALAERPCRKARWGPGVCRCDQVFFLGYGNRETSFFRGRDVRGCPDAAQRRRRFPARFCPRSLLTKCLPHARRPPAVAGRITIAFSNSSHGLFSHAEHAAG